MTTGDSGTHFPPPVLEPGPRTAQQRTLTVLLVAAVTFALVAIIGTFATLVYLIATGQI